MPAPTPRRSHSSVHPDIILFQTGSHGFANGDLVNISGVTGEDEELWNGTFGIYGVSDYSFKYYMRKAPFPFPSGSPQCRVLALLFDQVMRNAPERIKIHIGPGVFQTRGFAPNDARGWQPKTTQNIVGAGIDVTTLQLVGAVNPDQHYHAVGMPIAPSGSTAITPLKHFQISDLSIDCNVGNQPGRPDPGYPNVACGAVRILGDHARIRNVKAINWGTKSLKQGSFVLSVIHASGQPSGGDGNPIVTATDFNGIEDCVAIQPSKNNARETTILHIGGVKNATNHAQGFGTAAYIRQNYVDAQDKGQPSPPTAFFLRGRVQNATQVAVHCGCWPFPRRPRRRIRRGGGRRPGERVL